MRNFIKTVSRSLKPNKTVTLFLGAALTCSTALSRASALSHDGKPSEKLIVYFANNSTMLMRDYKTNGTALGKLDELLQTPEIIFALDSIVIQGASSIIGSFRTNERLAGERAAAVRGYIQWKHPHIDPGKIRIAPSVFNWEELRERVRQDPFVPSGASVLDILSLPLSDESKQAQIQLLDNGATENYIIDHFARYMRSATSLVFYMKEEAGKDDGPYSMPGDGPEPAAGAVTEKGKSPEPDDADERVPDAREQAPVARPGAARESKPLLAVKTNLLYDLGSALNLEMEVPLGRRWSVSAEWIFPWWLWEKKQYALEILNGNVEGRYWWGDRTRREPLTGWFTGVYAGGGYYDVEWKTKGYQGEFLSAGFTGGFAHRIGRNWRMEYSLGVGYLGSKYREYVPETICGDDQWHLIRKRHGQVNWVGPTRAKVSLVWMIHRSDRKKGGQ